MYNWSRGNSSRKLFEYMASGKPILSTVSMKYSPIEKYHCGISLEESTPKELARRILEIKSMKEEERERLGKNAREGAKDFDFKKLTETLVEVVEYVGISVEK